MTVEEPLEQVCNNQQQKTTVYAGHNFDLPWACTLNVRSTAPDALLRVAHVSMLRLRCTGTYILYSFPRAAAVFPSSTYLRRSERRGEGVCGGQDKKKKEKNPYWEKKEARRTSPACCSASGTGRLTHRPMQLQAAWTLLAHQRLRCWPSRTFS